MSTMTYILQKARIATYLHQLGPKRLLHNMRVPRFENSPPCLLIGEVTTLTDATR